MDFVLDAFVTFKREITHWSQCLYWQVVFPDMRCRWFIPKRDDLHVITPLKQRLITTVILSHSGWSGKLQSHPTPSSRQCLDQGTGPLPLSASANPPNLLKRERVNFASPLPSEHLWIHQRLPHFKGSVARWWACADLINESNGLGTLHF